jgi:hypothetical protein
MRGKADEGDVLVRDGAKPEAVLLHDLRAFIAAILAREERGLACHWRDYAAEAPVYAAITVVAFAVLCLIFGLGD